MGRRGCAGTVLGALQSVCLGLSPGLSRAPCKGIQPLCALVFLCMKRRPQLPRLGLLRELR